MQTKDNYTVISKETPLISNLNIIENISLIKESHEFMSAKKADEISMRY
jgi:ABC-type transporter Mla maintaining outer membrane lipid asymmetry ATPase subunit MlaF